MTFNGLMALISRYFTEFGSLQGKLRKSVRVRCRCKKFTFAISSPDEFLVIYFQRSYDSLNIECWSTYFKTIG